METIARKKAPGWRESVFTYLFDIDSSVRDEASQWLLGEPELNRAEHAHVLRDREWMIRYNAASGRLANPEVTVVPEWVPDLFADALARERNAVVARQILLLLSQHAPERFPTELPSRIREDRGSARAGFGLGLLRIDPERGWNLLVRMLEREEWYAGTIFVLTALTGGEFVTDLRPRGAEAYIAALSEWIATMPDSSAKDAAIGRTEALRNLARSSALV